MEDYLDLCRNVNAVKAIRARGLESFGQVENFPMHSAGFDKSRSYSPPLSDGVLHGRVSGDTRQNHTLN